jgi:hypothetical protein
MTQYRHRTARERAALESAQKAIARAQAHVRQAVPEVESVAPTAPPPTAPRFVPQEESTSSAAAWRRRCRQIREEIDAERSSSAATLSSPSGTETHS